MWALPAIRALSRRMGEPVDLMVAAPFASICPLIEQQSYIRHCAALEDWQPQDPAPINPRVPPNVRVPWSRWPVMETEEGGWRGLYDCVLHLGYRDWPKRPLPFETLDCLNEQIGHQRWGFVSSEAIRNTPLADAELALDEPWITTSANPQYRPPIPSTAIHTIAVGFTDEHFELKFGLRWLLVHSDWDLQVIGDSPRWSQEAGAGRCTWSDSVEDLQQAVVFLGCNSALHVLAVACGVPVVMMEPNPMRHHSIFYPLGQDGPHVTLVKGVDGLPTWDSRRVRDALERVLRIGETIRPLRV